MRALNIVLAEFRSVQSVGQPINATQGACESNGVACVYRCVYGFSWTDLIDLQFRSLFHPCQVFDFSAFDCLPLFIFCPNKSECPFGLKLICNWFFFVCLPIVLWVVMEFEIAIEWVAWKLFDCNLARIWFVGQQQMDNWTRASQSFVVLNIMFCVIFEINICPVVWECHSLNKFCIWLWPDKLGSNIRSPGLPRLANKNLSVCAPYWRCNITAWWRCDPETMAAQPKLNKLCYGQLSAPQYAKNRVRQPFTNPDCLRVERFDWKAMDDPCSRKN